MKNNKIKKSIIFLAGLVMGYFLTSYMSKHMNSHSSMNSKSMTMSHTMAMEEKHEAKNKDNPPYIESLKVIEDPMGGWNLYFDYYNFKFTPENVNKNHIESEGHAHLHINGEKSARLYSNFYHISNLPEGDNVISVFLNTNEHKEYVLDGIGTGVQVVVSNLK